MNMLEKYNALNLISEKTELNETDLKILIDLSEDDNSEIRMRVAELLIMSNEDEAKGILLKLSTDSDELVRVCACDSLSVFSQVDVYNKLIESILTDDSKLVKRYALLSLTDIMNCLKLDSNQLENIFSKMLDENEIAISAVCYKGLYLLGYENYLNNLLSLLKTDDYQDKCAVINIIGEIINERNYRRIILELNNVMGDETSKAVLSTINCILKKFKNN